MGFNTVVPVMVGGAAPGSVRYRVVISKKKPPEAILSIPLSIIVAADLNDGDKFRLLVGDGTDSGKLRLVKDAQGVVKLKVTTFARGAQVGIVRLGAFDAVGKVAVPPQSATHTAIHFGIELAIPALRAMPPVMR
jgi:hypothetical protein